MAKQETASQLRTRIMRSVKGKNTLPELQLRALLHRQGLRFRVHQKLLPGTPDIVLKKHLTIIFVHGCFWHGHNCKKGRLPKSNKDFWIQKISNNKIRDHKNITDLRKLGWKTVVVWSCQIKNPHKVLERIGRVLNKL